MKALTLWQPWATLMFTEVHQEGGLGTWRIAKRFETRSRPWNHRGFVAIHSAKIIPEGTAKLVCSSPFREVLGIDNIPDEPGFPRVVDLTKVLPLGVIIGLVWMEQCLTTEKAIRHPRMNHLERQFGNYNAGRYAYYCTFARKLKEPVQINGHQGIWHWQENREAIESMAEIRRVFKGQIDGTEKWF